MLRRDVIRLGALAGLNAACGTNPLEPGAAKPGPSGTGSAPDPARPSDGNLPLKLSGRLKQRNGVFFDATGPRRPIGYTDMPALRVWQDRRDEALETLSAAQSAGWQYVRCAYGLAESESQDKGYWRGAMVLPEKTTKPCLIPFADAARARGLKLELFGGHRFPDQKAELDFIDWMAKALRDAGHAETVALFEWRNEYLLTSPYDAATTDAVGVEAMRIMRSTLGCLCTMGAPGEDDEAIRHSVQSAEVASIDALRGHSGDLLMKHAHRFFYDGRHKGRYLGRALWATEPTGPNGRGGDVYLPLEDRDYLFGLAAIYALTGQAFTFFNGPAVRHRQPLDATWGFRELPGLLALIPEDIGTWKGISWFTKGSQFVSVLAEAWNMRPDRPVKSIRYVGADGRSKPLGADNTPAPGWKAALILGEWA